MLRLSIALPPMFNMGIMSAPALPNRSSAVAVFSTPSGMAANRLATSNVIWSALLRFPAASLALTPSRSKAGPTLSPLLPMLNRPRSSFTRLFDTASMSVPLVAAAFLNFARASTLTPVFWLMSLSASPASMVLPINAPRPPIVTAGTTAPSAPLSSPARLAMDCAAPSAALSLPCNCATCSVPVTLAPMRRIASRFIAPAPAKWCARSPADPPEHAADRPSGTGYPG